ncbi:MAG: AAA family ATPase [Proteobacteria bacterium]|nr:AAA family ATPase [Pseudomonadota bacterium]
MIALSGYRKIDAIQESERAVLYRGERSADNESVLIKSPKKTSNLPKESTRLRHEYEITGRSNIAGIVRAVALEETQDGAVLVFEDEGGQPLDEFIPSNGLPLRDFLRIAVSISEVLIEIHHHSIIHMMIRPSNILYNRKNGSVKIKDFSVASLLSTGKWQVTSSDWSKRTLAYMSPEQTGRMNRDIDWRTDMYSLGITFYEMLTGRLPFQADDPMEWIHCHIAKIPISPHKLNPGIPEAVSDIAMMCLSKMAEDRYQSIFGLKLDLEECLKRLAETGKIEFFFPGCNDISDRFQIPQKLYGREKEIDELVGIFNRVAVDGTTEFVTVCGYAGIGKSFLIYEMQKSIVEQRGYFIRGKFDQYKRYIPYDCLIQAFQELVRQLLTESDPQISQWKSKLQNALGPNGQVIIDVIPEVELIVGQQPPIQKLSPEEAQNRFNTVFQNFVHTFSAANHPLVIYLDDLQWADSASLKLIELLITDPAVKYLLMIGAFRDNEIGDSHLLPLTFENIRKAEIRTHQFKLAPLDLEQINQFCSDTLHCPLESSQALAELIISKTRGNPFFVNQFLTALYEDKLLQFDVGQRKWIWDQNKIQDREITDNVIHFMSAKIQKLSPPVQNILKLAACIGNQFDFHILSLANDQPPAESTKALWKSIQEGLIISDFGFQISNPSLGAENGNGFFEIPAENPSFRFLHDRVQQAAYSLITDNKRKRMHHRIGRLMLEKSSALEIDENVFDIANQLNFGGDMITRIEERNELARLNLKAGKKAKESTAYGPALQYLLTGMNLLKAVLAESDKADDLVEPEADNGFYQESWEREYDLTADLFRERAECEYLNGNFENAEKLFEIILRKVKTPFEKADVYSTKAVLYTNLGRNDEAVQLGIEGLKLLGMHLPTTPSKAAILLELIKVVWKLRQRKLKDLFDLPNMVDMEKMTIMSIIMDMYPPAYFTNQNLFALLILKVLRLTLTYGNAQDTSPYAYSAFGFLIGSGFGRYQAGLEFGKLGIQISEKYNNTKLLGFSNFVLGCFINNWVRPAQTSDEYLLKGYQHLVESGTFVYAGYSAASLIFNMSVTGRSLDEIDRNAGKYLKFANLIKDANSANFFIVAQRYVKNLKGLTSALTSFSDGQFDEEGHVDEMKNSSERVPYNWYCIKKMQILYLFGKYAEALEIAGESETLLETSMGQTFIVEHFFYHSLILAALYPAATPSTRRKYRKILRRNRRKMKRWVKTCPENFLHKSLLMAAETARVDDNGTKAADLYNRAIQSAQENKYLQNEALGNELAARHYLARGMGKIAQAYLKEAYACYLDWGATAKVNHLKKDYPELLSGISFEQALDDERPPETQLEAPDLASIIKASQAIASEILLNKLLKNLMQIVIENAGAKKGFLILQKEGKWTVEVEGGVDREKGVFLKPFPLELIDAEQSPLPLSIFHYVARTGENLVLHDASLENAFVKDSFIVKYQPKSVLCAPILHKSKMIGMLYLENNLITGAFTPERLEVLKLLSSQAAISIENARLYADQKTVNDQLQNEIAERMEAEERLRAINEALETSNIELKETQSQLVQSAKLASIGELATGVAHELNQPLMYIRSSAQLELMEESEDLDPLSVRETLKDVEKGTSHMMTIINHLRDFARPMELELQSTDLNDVLEESLILVNEQIRIRNIQLEKEFSPHLPSVLGNSHQLEQVFINLLTNARDALEKNEEPLLTIETGFHPGDNGTGEVSVSFTDNGCGISKSVVDKIFDPFFSTKETGKGTGLGLSISYGIVRDHNGRIEASSIEGQGTTFTVVLPAMKKPDDEDGCG